MKVFILALLINGIALASHENWMAKTKILSGSVEAHQLKGECERISGEKCFDVGGHPSSVYSSIVLKSNTQACVDANDCQLKLEQISCDGLESVKNLELMEVYCVEPSVVLDQDKLAAHESAALAAAQLVIDRAAAIQAKRESGALKLQNAQALDAVEAKLMMSLPVTDQELGL